MLLMSGFWLAEGSARSIKEVALQMERRELDSQIVTLARNVTLKTKCIYVYLKWEGNIINLNLMSPSQFVMPIV